MAQVLGTDIGETLTGTNGNDAIYGYGGDDALYGFGNGPTGPYYGWETLVGGEGADRLYGGGGHDLAEYWDSTVGVTVNLATGTGSGGTAEGDLLYSIELVTGSGHDDILIGSEVFNSLYGGNGNDLLRGTGGIDYLSGDGLFGDAGDDTLEAGGGPDYLHGGAGYDTVLYSASQHRVFVSLDNNIGAYGDAEGDEYIFIENITGSAFGDDLWGHNGDNVLNGGDGNDSLKGLGAEDTLRGENGDDFLDGGTGYDVMIGGPGNDTYYVDHLDDFVIESGGQGNDRVRTTISYGLPQGADIERLEVFDPSGTTAIELYGNSSGNDIIGNNGGNLIIGGGGVDQMTGLGGSDRYSVDHANDRVIEAGGQGNDSVYTSVSWTLTAGSDVELITTDYDLGTTAINLTGNANGNILRGNNGNNTLNGREGRDDLTGLGGQDQFLFNTPLTGASNVDRVIDFNVADDTILLDNAVFSSSLGLGNISAGEFVIGTAAQDANDRIIYNSGTGALFYDNDGAGGNAQVQFAELSRGLALTNLDFLVVTGTTIPPLGGGRLPVTRPATTDFATDSTTGKTSPVEYIDLNSSFAQQDYLL